jgi:hypothetical protein
VFRLSLISISSINEKGRDPKGLRIGCASSTCILVIKHAVLVMAALSRNMHGMAVAVGYHLHWTGPKTCTRSMYSCFLLNFV